MSGKKVFALLWAFGLTVGINGMTVCAVEPDAAVKEESAKEESGAAKEAPAEDGYVSRIVSFTDCTGMRVTYDANACRQYVYTVEDGVLVGVTTETVGEEGETVSKAVTFEGTVELEQPEEGEKYTSIAADLFAGNQDITYVKLPVGVNCIPVGGFKGCTALESVYLPPTVKIIEKDAFRDCTAMTQIALPKSVSTIGENAFAGDTKLELVYFRGIHDGWSSVSDRAFPSAEEAEALVIMGEKGSMAEIYARRHGLPFEEKEPEE